MLQQTKVLIIGAGPTGLMAACQLRRQGIEPVIIDKKEGPSQESKAVVLHARSVEIYDQLGIANEALLKGEIVENVQLIIKGKKVQQIPLRKIGEGASPFPFLLILEQSKNEELLYTHLQKLGGEVAWQTEMISILEEEGGAIVGVKQGKDTYDIRADYVIAADGASSAVREALDVPFLTNRYEKSFFLADTELNWKWGRDAFSIYISGQAFMALFPMQGKERFRVIGALPPEYKERDPESFEELHPLLEKQLEVPVQFSNTNWFSVYRLRHRCLETFRKGCVFFAGDSAHIHSPAGGHGMNTGLQDAYNLAWKLTMTIKGTGSNNLLNTYEQERLPFAKHLIASNDKLFGMLTSTNFFHRAFRLTILPLFLPLFVKFKKYRKRVFRALSQIGIKYINSDLTINRILHPLSIKAGEQFPYLITKEGTSVYHLMKASLFHAFVFAHEESSLVKDMKALETELGKIIQVHDFSGEAEIRAKLKIKGNVVILVRPDHYIGLITDEGAKVVSDYLRRLADERKPEGVFVTKTHQ